MSPAKRQRKRSGKRSVASTSGKKPRIVKGRVNLRVAGYSGLQKIPPSKLIPFLPATKLRQAAKRALGLSGGGGKRKKTLRGRRRRKRTKTRRTRRKN